MKKNDLFDYKDLFVFQNDKDFKFSLDSILLAEFVNIKLTTKTIVDFCTGIGTIPLILSTKTKAKIYGIEVQESVFKLAQKSVQCNNISNIEYVNDNIFNAKNYFKNIDIVVCNPPYFKTNPKSLINKNENKAIARHEIATNLKDIIKISGEILKETGHLYLSHRPERLIEIVKILGEYKFSIKKIQLIYSKFEKNAIILLIDACKGGKEGLIVSPPIDISKYNSYQNIFKKNQTKKLKNK